MKPVLICGVDGQDGAYLAKLLLGKGYEVFGTSRDAQVSTFSNNLFACTGYCLTMNLAYGRSDLSPGR